MKYNLLPTDFISVQDKKLQDLLVEARQKDDSALCTIIAGQLSMLLRVQEAMNRAPKFKKVMEEAFDSGREHSMLVDFGEPVVEFSVERKEFFKFF